MPEDLRQRIVTLADQCVMCGLCLPACPTYDIDGRESESPRGRIALARALAAGEADMDAGTRLPLDHCLGCMRCERVCPSGVRYGELLVATRNLLGPAPQRPRQLLAVLMRPRRLRRLASLARALRLPAWLARWPRRGHAGWRTALALLAHRRPAAAPLPAPPPATADAERIALFTGCVSQAEDPDAGRAAAALLAAAGFAVERVDNLCCGALARHDGDATLARAAAAAVRTRWQQRPAARLLTVNPGCLDTLRAALPGVDVEDASGFLARHAERLRFRPLPRRVALHHPCTEVNVARSDEPLRQLLARVPQLEVAEVPAPPHCCGAAGSHVLTFPQRAATLRRVKQTQIDALAATRLLSSNIGCRLHLAVGRGADALPDEHPLTLLARQLEVS